MSQLSVLIISDELSIASIWGMCLQEQIHRAVVNFALYGKHEELLNDFPSLIVLDIAHRKTSGVKVLNEIRSVSSAPVIVFSPINNESYQLELYEAGADDCFIKPVSPQLFLAKVNAWLRHVPISTDMVKTDKDNDSIYLNPSGRRLMIDGREVHLSNHEFRILQLLLNYPNKPFSVEEIRERIWVNGHGDPGLVKNMIYRLRKKIENDPGKPEYLVTEPHQGYLFRKLA